MIKFFQFFSFSYIFIYMGRKRKYHSLEQAKEAQKKWAKEYYYRNKEDINQKTMEKYYAGKNEILPLSKRKS